MKTILQTLVFASTAALAGAVWAKLPPPSDEAKAKAAETSAKTAWAGKVDAFLLCKAQDRTAAYYQKKKAAPADKSKPAAKPVAAPACADPGPFVYTPAAPATAAAPAAPAPAAAPAAQTAAAAAPKKP